MESRFVLWLPSLAANALLFHKEGEANRACAPILPHVVPRFLALEFDVRVPFSVPDEGTQDQTVLARPIDRTSRTEQPT